MSRNATRVLYSNEDQAKFSRPAGSIILLKPPPSPPTKLLPQRCFDRIEILKLNCFSHSRNPFGVYSSNRDSLARPKWSVLGRRGIGGGLRIEIRRCGRDGQASQPTRSEAERRGAAAGQLECRIIPEMPSNAPIRI